jgi:hypothetical protein
MPSKNWTLLVLAVLTLAPAKALPWAENGHRIVAAIAEKRLSPTARKAVKELLGADSMARVSTWMDFIKSDQEFDDLNNYHYVEMSKGNGYWASEKNPKGDIVTAIIHYEDVLRNKRSTMEERKIALKSLIHLIGDIHQPLHACLAGDRCATMLWLQWFNDQANLHKVWDESLIELQKLSYTEYVDFLDHISNSEVNRWQKSSVIDWLTESAEYREQIYAGLRDEKGKKIYKLSYRYNFDNIGLVEQRLKQAGVRLAFFLNNIFAGRKNVNGAEIRKKLADLPKLDTL